MSCQDFSFPSTSTCRIHLKSSCKSDKFILRPSTCWASLNRPCVHAEIELRATRHYYVWCHINHGPWTDWYIPPHLRSRLREPRKHWHYMKNRKMQWRCIGSIETLPLHLLYGELTTSNTGRQGLSIRFTSVCGPHRFCLHLKVLNVLRNRVNVLIRDNGSKPRCGPSLGNCDNPPRLWQPTLFYDSMLRDHRFALNFIHLTTIC